MNSMVSGVLNLEKRRSRRISRTPTEGSALAIGPGAGVGVADISTARQRDLTVICPIDATTSERSLFQFPSSGVSAHGWLTMVRTWGAFLGLMTLATLLAGCVTVACDVDDPQYGKDCYECTRKATLDARKVHPDKGSRISIKDKINDRTEECLRERGYIKQKREDRP
ncbi:MAG: hypothetical protein ABIU05_16440 [Nitrospirales bacterium]